MITKSAQVSAFQGEEYSFTVRQLRHYLVYSPRFTFKLIVSNQTRIVFFIIVLVAFNHVILKIISGLHSRVETKVVISDDNVILILILL